MVRLALDLPTAIAAPVPEAMAGVGVEANRPPEAIEARRAAVD